MKTIFALLALILCTLPGMANAGWSESSLRQFLLSIPDTYGWQPEKGDISYDFFPDGRLHVQGPDGEATMWEGTWKLKGDQLTIVVPERKTNKTYTASKKGDALLLDGVRYRRYIP